MWLPMKPAPPVTSALMVGCVPAMPEAGEFSRSLPQKKFAAREIYLAAKPAFFCQAMSGEFSSNSRARRFSGWIYGSSLS
jgi:hypothetical protein